MAGSLTPSIPTAILKHRQLHLTLLVTISFEDMLASRGRVKINQQYSIPTYIPPCHKAHKASTFSFHPLRFVARGPRALTVAYDCNPNARLLQSPSSTLFWVDLVFFLPSGIHSNAVTRWYSLYFLIICPIQFRLRRLITSPIRSNKKILKLKNDYKILEMSVETSSSSSSSSSSLILFFGQNNFRCSHSQDVNVILIIIFLHTKTLLVIVTWHLLTNTLQENKRAELGRNDNCFSCARFALIPPHPFTWEPLAPQLDFRSHHQLLTPSTLRHVVHCS